MVNNTAKTTEVGLLLTSGLATGLGAACLLAALSPGCPAQTLPEWSGATVKRTVLEPDIYRAPNARAQASVMTSNGCHVAKVEASPATGYLVRRDGKPGRRYAGVDAPAFSQDGSTLAYVATKEAKQCAVVVNEEEDPAFQAVVPATVALSGRGKRQAYLASQLGRPIMVIDGQVQGNAGLTPLSAQPVFSPNGSKVAYAARHHPSRKLCVVVNGLAGDRQGAVGDLHDGLDPRFLTFSADGTHLAYAAQEGAKWFRVLDGKRGPPFDGVGIDFVFSADGKRTAYTGRNGPMRALVVDGKVEAKIEGIVDGTLTFSPDGRRLACAVAKHDGSAYLWVDGTAGPVHDDIGGSVPPGSALNRSSGASGLGAGAGVLFSPDSRHLAYLARSGQTRRVYLDGQAEEVEMDFLVSGMVFSGDSRRLAHGGRRGNRFFLVADGKKGADYDALGYFGFSPDGKHLAFTAQKGDKMVIVVDGQERAQYDMVPAGPVFRWDGVLEFLAADKASLYRIEVTDLWHP